ncbi:MAG: DUF22 domain-containing protein [Methanobacterium sp.]|uniref:DUF22 domain-containing protein n=1 Tax=Methanobacterium sp. TaxID=2164 RepID=UPI003D6465B7|nr:DUF22 domain-containing protein [Methanobacterium sp.]
MVRIIQRLDKVKQEYAELEAHALGDFKVGKIIGKMRAIISDEDIDVKANEATPIKIQQIKIPKNHITFLSAYAANRYGHAVAVGGEIHLPISLDKTVDHASFLASINGTIKKDDLLGVLILLPIEMLK